MQLCSQVPCAGVTSSSGSPRHLEHSPTAPVPLSSLRALKLGLRSLLCCVQLVPKGPQHQRLQLCRCLTSSLVGLVVQRCCTGLCCCLVCSQQGCDHLCPKGFCPCIPWGCLQALTILFFPVLYPASCTLGIFHVCWTMVGSIVPLCLRFLWWPPACCRLRQQDCCCWLQAAPLQALLSWEGYAAGNSFPGCSAPARS